MVTRLSRKRYFEPLAPQRASWDEPAKMGYFRNDEHFADASDTDVYALQALRVISVTPLSLDLTSRVDLGELERLLRAS
jgi:5'-nucleotidase